MSNFCPFTPAQLSFMIEIDSLDDWRSECFVAVLQQHVDTAETDISPEEFSDLVEKLQHVPIPVIRDLQVALCILGSFPTQIYYRGNFIPQGLEGIFS
jgi:hypothetical protein